MDSQTFRHPYVIMGPPYRHTSAGVRALYELQRYLVERGYEAVVSNGATIPSDHIAIYPETVSGNPMNGKTVVRYVLNYPGLIGGDEEYDPAEIIFAYSPMFYPDVPILTVPIIEDFFCDKGLSRSGGCFWVGKGEGKVEEDVRTKGLIEITPNWPKTRRGLADLLNSVEVFYSYDDCTALISEAEKCGCKVIIIPELEHRVTYDEFIKDFDSQLDYFIQVTQAAARTNIKKEKKNNLNVNFGVMINDPLRFDMVLRRSQVVGSMNFVYNPESATKGLNRLLDKAENEGADICILAHQDMYFRSGWVDQVCSQIKLLPDSWIVAGVIGKDGHGITCGKFHDMRVPDHFDTSDIHTFPHEACCFDECVIIVNMKKGFRFDESLEGFDLYGTLCVLQAWEMGGTAFVIDAFCEHYCLRPFTWHPCDLFVKNYKTLYDRFSAKWKVDSTALGLSPDASERIEQLRAFFTSAPNEEIAA